MSCKELLGVIYANNVVGLVNMRIGILRSSRHRRDIKRNMSIPDGLSKRKPKAKVSGRVILMKH